MFIHECIRDALDKGRSHMGTSNLGLDNEENFDVKEENYYENYPTCRPIYENTNDNDIVAEDGRMTDV